MSHLIKIYAVCKFSFSRLWYLKEFNYWNVRFDSDILLNNGSLFYRYFLLFMKQ